jgi:protein-disulfide isomerase
MEKSRPDVIGTILVVCAVAMTALVGYRTFVVDSKSATSGSSAPPTMVAEGDELVRGREFEGPTSASVRIIEFADFECPACRGYQQVLDSTRARHAADVAVAFAHFPLEYHRFARPAARAAECARLQGRFFQMARLLFLRQDSLGLKAWTEYARDAGVGSLEAFGACAARSDAIPGVETDLRLAQAIGARATPTVVVNGWRFDSPPSEQQLDSVVRATIGVRTP